MDTFHYYNMFETKGIEYLITIVFFLLLIPFWIILNNREKVVKGIQYALGVLSLSKIRIPQGIYYCPDHTWTYLRKTGAARIGVDDLLTSITGKLMLEPVVNEGAEVKKGDPIAKIIQDKKQLTVHSPLTGTIKLSNHQIMENPDLILSDPYGQGWMFEIKPQSWKSETSGYYLADEAVKWTSDEIVRFKDFLAQSLQKHNDTPSLLALQDGGELRKHLLADLPNEVWIDFQHDFLKTS
ncbi:MAG: hypothetical protein K0B15_11125 [Lentimicrobium sp.]|nr:hypothetical protein [Lentimicrobium sp.]